MLPGIEWDPEKARHNNNKHGIEFAEAVTALEDDYAVTIEELHSGEIRFITIGSSDTGKVLVVVYTFRGVVVRLISARRATPAERKIYEKDKA
jgi:hypothetical protein